MQSFSGHNSILRILLICVNLLAFVLIILEMSNGYTEFPKRTYVKYNQGIHFIQLNWLISVVLIVLISLNYKINVKRFVLHSVLLIVSLFFYLLSNVAPWGINPEFVFWAAFYLIPIQIILYNILYSEQNIIWFTSSIMFVLFFYIMGYFIMIDIWRHFKLFQSGENTISKLYGITIDLDLHYVTTYLFYDFLTLLIHSFLLVKSLTSFVGYCYLKKKRKKNILK